MLACVLSNFLLAYVRLQLAAWQRVACSQLPSVAWVSGFITMGHGSCARRPLHCMVCFFVARACRMHDICRASAGSSQIPPRGHTTWSSGETRPQQPRAPWRPCLCPSAALELPPAMPPQSWLAAGRLVQALAGQLSLASNIDYSAPHRCTALHCICKFCLNANF